MIISMAVALILISPSMKIAAFLQLTANINLSGPKQCTR